MKITITSEYIQLEKIASFLLIAFAGLSLSCQALEVSKLAAILMVFSFVIWLKEKTELLLVFSCQNVWMIAILR